MKNDKSTLARIGRELRTKCERLPGQTAQITLKQGLTLVLLYRPPRWQLSLVREDVYPSDRELETVKTHFGYIPDYARHEQELKTQGNTDYYIRRLKWEELEQLALFDSPKSGIYTYYRE